jgi:hypothetical protein
VRIGWTGLAARTRRTDAGSGGPSTIGTSQSRGRLKGGEGPGGARD